MERTRNILLSRLSLCLKIGRLSPMSSRGRNLHTIDLSDSNAFAHFSGDFNKIHLDAEFARRQFYGTTVVHGMHVVLLALDSLSIDSFDELKIKFSRAIFQGECFHFVFCHTHNLINVCDSSGKPAISIFIHGSSKKFSRCFRNGSINSIDYENRKHFDSLSLGLTLNAFIASRIEFANVLFPNLVNAIGVGLVCELSRVSSIVGMQIPGEFSILSGAKILFGNNLLPESLKVSYLDNRARFLKLNYIGQNFHAEISAFSPLPPGPIPPLADIKQELIPILKQGLKKSLVIGGSRGLGEWISKSLAVLGRDVTLTYSTGKTDAQKIQDEILSFGAKCFIMKLDVLEETNLKLLESVYDEVYYCATPRIRQDDRILQSLEEQYQCFEKYYVHTFTRIVEILNKPGTRFFFPSSSFLHERPTGFGAYIEAKENGEKNCESLISRLGVDIKYLRLPMLDTDQTRGIWKREGANTLREIRRIIEYMD